MKRAIIVREFVDEELTHEDKSAVFTIDFFDNTIHATAFRSGY